MELVAMDMKLRGMYAARQLSFHGVSFSVSEVDLPDKFIEAYDASVQLVRYNSHICPIQDSFHYNTDRCIE